MAVVVDVYVGQVASLEAMDEQNTPSDIDPLGLLSFRLNVCVFVRVRVCGQNTMLVIENNLTLYCPLANDTNDTQFEFESRNNLFSHLISMAIQ